jgi:hypothetical protein
MLSLQSSPSSPQTINRPSRGGGLPTILQAVFFAHFIKGMRYILCILSK